MKPRRRSSMISVLFLFAALLMPGAADATADASCGPSWSIVSSPNPEALSSRLYEVEALSANDVWAVGAYETSTGTRTLIEHWDGSEWSIVPSPNGPQGDGHLFDISAVSSHDIWAVGGSGSGTPLIQHWDGRTWKVVKGPNAGVLTGVFALSSDDVWAVGYNGVPLTIHWDGTQWKAVPTPAPQGEYSSLRDVSGTSPSDVWAVGSVSAHDQSQPLTERWDGTRWRIVNTPDTNYFISFLNGVSALSPNDVWAVGANDTGGSDASVYTLTQHWDGRRWQIVPSPSVSDPQYEFLVNYLTDVVAIASDNAWASGFYWLDDGVYGDDVLPSQTLIQRWDGSEWSIVPTPSVGAGKWNFLQGIDGLSDGHVWAVGYYGDDRSSNHRTLIEHRCDGEQPPSTSCTIRGTPGGDTLRGTAKRDVICGFGGADAISGFRGHDRLFGGKGNDLLEGGRGRDRIAGNEGNDRIKGGRAADRLLGGKGKDRLRAGRGPDTVFGGPGDDVMRSVDGTGGNDVVAGDNGRDLCVIDKGDRAFECERVVRKGT